MELRDRAGNAGLSSRIEILGRRAQEAREALGDIVVAWMAGEAFFGAVDAGEASGRTAGAGRPVPVRSEGVGAGETLRCRSGAGRATGVTEVTCSVCGVQETSVSTGSAFGGTNHASEAVRVACSASTASPIVVRSTNTVGNSVDASASGAPRAIYTSAFLSQQLSPGAGCAVVGSA